MKDEGEITVAEKQISHSPAAAQGSTFHQPSIVNRLGTISIWLFFGSAIVIGNLIAFLTFLWFGHEQNTAWRAIVVKDWMTRSISFTSTALRFCTTMQTALSLSMLAAISLEKFYISHSEVAAVSMMRIGGNGLVGTLKDFIYPMASRKPQWSLPFVMLIFSTILLLLSSTVLQFTSTLLLSDMRTLPIPEFSHNVTGVPYDYRWNDDTGFGYDLISTTLAWGSIKPILHPTFAEYTNSSSIIVEDGVSDTGTTIRAFLPFSSSEERNRIRNYTGSAVVLDSRVTCIRPNITGARYGNTSDTYYVYGRVQPSLHLSHINSASKPIPFSCAMDQSGTERAVSSICELNNDAQYGFPTKNVAAGGLLSEFRTSKANISGAAYLILGAGLVPGDVWEPVNVSVDPSKGDDPDYQAFFNFTLCYAALDAVDRSIKAYSDSNRTEVAVSGSMVVAENGEKYPGYDFSTLIPQLTPGSSVEKRGILNLELQEGETWAHDLSRRVASDGPWAVINPNLAIFSSYNDPNMSAPDPSAYLGYTPENLPYLVNTLHSRRIYPENNTGIGATSIVMLDDEFFDLYTIGSQTWVGWLLNEFLDTQSDGTPGSASRALQAVLTVLASVHYYDRLNTYEKTTNATVTEFGSHQFAKGPYDWNYNATIKARGESYYPHFSYSWHYRVAPFYTLVLTLLFVHELNVLCIFLWFMKSTKFSRLGDPWQAIAQVVAGEETSRVVELSAQMSTNRRVVYRELQSTGFEHVKVGLGTGEDGKIILRRHDG